MDGENNDEIVRVVNGVTIRTQRTIPLFEIHGVTEGTTSSGQAFVILELSNVESWDDGETHYVLVMQDDERMVGADEPVTLVLEGRAAAEDMLYVGLRHTEDWGSHIGAPMLQYLGGELSLVKLVKREKDRMRVKIEIAGPFPLLVSSRDGKLRVTVMEEEGVYAEEK
jgi:hypothetical protein